MAPPAAKNFRQSQPITTGLRVICESYPANTCLRELLQNADDAGATEIEYVLDTKSYTDTPLLHNSLNEYHGPALLARNNSVFTDEDFSSLSSVGDSRKRNDATTTGKFGLGFNSVYHWTDGPWIYSRNWLLMLDPHEWWSGDSGNPGGPAWDVVQNQACVELQNHLKTFRTFELDTTQEFQQTIIRVPLRTAAQATRSKIVRREITVEEIEIAIKQFAEEMKEGGLLFLKHIQSIILRIDDETISRIRILEEGSDFRARDQLPLDFKRQYVPDTPLQQDISRTLSLRTEYSDVTSSSTQSYLIQHTMMKSSGDSDLDDWARERKLFAWTAVAVLLNQNSSETPFCGRLYCTLRMPILTNHPAHIHGLWAITPDRSRLSSSGQSLGYEDEATRWNKFLFQMCVSQSWAKLLLQRSHFSFKEEIFGLWPQVTSTPVDFWARLDDWVIDKIISGGLPVWNAQGKCVDIKSAYLFLDDSSNQRYASAIANVMPSAVFLKEAFFNKVIERSATGQEPKQVATPSMVRQFLRDHLPVIQAHTAPLLLEYCLLDALQSDRQGKSRSILYEGFQGLLFWPNVNGGFSSAGHLLLPRDAQEMELFKAARKTETLDINRIAPSLLNLFRRDIDYLSAVMRFRTIFDFPTDWPLIYPVSQGVSNLSPLQARNSPTEPTLKTAWNWISQRYNQHDGFPSTFDELRLLPVNNSRIRKFVPIAETNPMLIASKPDSLYRSMVEMARSIDIDAPSILDIEILSASALTFLRKQTLEVPRFRAASLNDFRSFLSWLVASRDMIAAATEEQKVSVLQRLEILAKKSTDYSIHSNLLIKENLKKLALFNRVECSAPFDTQTLVRRDLTGHKYPLTVPTNLPPLPQIQDVAFFSTLDATDRYVADSFGLLETMSSETLLRDHLRPWTVATAGSFGAVKDRLVHFLLSAEHFRNPSRSWIELIANLPIIPTSAHEDHLRPGRRRIVDLIRPETLLSKLFFENEEVFPEPNFFQRHKTVLNICRIKNEPTWADLVGRICYFSQCQADFHDLAEKVKILLSIPPPSDFRADNSNIHRIQTLKWLPGTLVMGGHMSLLSPQDCRGPDQESLTCYVLGSTSFSAWGDWNKILGWDTSIDRSLLLRQLGICVEKNDHERIDRVLSSLQPNDYPEIEFTKCILGSRKNYWFPSKISLPNSLLSTYPLLPFLDEVDSLFAQHHPKLMEDLKIRQQPSIGDLIEVQRTLQASTPSLNDSNVAVAINSLEIAIRLPPTDDVAGILIPDSQGILRNLADIVHGDRNVTGAVAAFNYTHPMISSNVIERLEVENSLARATRLAIDFDDQDEDEYTLEEKLTDIISDTLGRYSLESTFNEFLANADDCAAKKISWILDECLLGSYESKVLLTPELAAFQGAALFVHNDGEFSAADFDGLRAIGRGGKGNTFESTGMFGRGALSMYHFTDVPMIISGKHFLILDPQQNSLPRNKHHKRKIGVKITLSNARRICLSHLTPFNGLCGFSSDLDHYSGTLFRFPFRGKNITRLKETDFFIESEKTKSLLDNYFEDASMALLFLRNIESVDLFIRGQDHPRWRVSATRSDVPDGEIFCQMKIRSQREHEIECEKVWRIGQTDIINCPSNIIKPGRGAAKITECGIAACISHPETSQRIFCTLPTPFKSYIPISFHASFAVTGDRKSIPFEDVRRDSVVAEWNNWLLTDCVPRFYLDFLNDLAPKMGNDAFQYWPVKQNRDGTPKLVEAVIGAFWDKLSENDMIPLFPLAHSIHAQNDASSLKIRSSGKVRKLYATTSLRTAQFDLLPQETSSQLRPLLLKICSSLVIIPPILGLKMRYSKVKKSMTILGPKSLCDLFQSESKCKILAEFYAREWKPETEGVHPMSLLIELLMEQAGFNPESLNYLSGCRVLPKLDGSLGLLTIERNAGFEWNLIANIREQELFDFTRSSFVNSNLFQRPSFILSADSSMRSMSRNHLKDMDDSNLNVRFLELHDVGILLARDDSPLHQMNGQNRASWVQKLWQYLNERFHIECDKDSSENIVSHLLAQSGLQDTPVYRMFGSKEGQYCTPNQFETEACMVNPSTPEHRDLCRAIKDLRLADQSCLPFWLLNESDLSNLQSFIRLIRALKVIERPSKVNLTAYLDQDFTEQNREILRTMLTRHLNDVKDQAEYMEVLRALPIWPCSSHPHKIGISALNGICCTHKEMLMPWIKNLGEFIHPDTVRQEKSSLIALGCKPLKISEAWLFVTENFPPDLKKVDPKAYSKLLLAIDGADLKISVPIAPNGHGILCASSSLYDHNDEIFRAAFRYQEATRFLHKDLRRQDLSRFWKSNGLRTRSVSQDMDGADFLQCALAIKSRNENISNLESSQDAATVAAYLSWDRPCLRKWTDYVWDQVSMICIFAVADERSTPFVYRQPRMHELAQKKSHYALLELGRETDRPIVWSQMAFPQMTVAPYAFERLPRQGHPPASAVLSHLKYLIGLRGDVTRAELAEYLRDIQASYTYLQDHTEETRQIPAIESEKIWINLDTSNVDTIDGDDISQALYPARLLCLNCPSDPLPLKVVRKFLIPYEKLLASLGCRSVIQPPRVRKSSTGDIGLPMTSAMKEIQKFRHEGAFVDVIFQAESMDKPAHKIFMAAVSQYCKAQFTGRWGQLRSDNVETIKLDDIKFKALSQMVDFAYTGETNFEEVTDRSNNEEIAERLDELFDLLRSTDRWILNYLHQLTEDHVVDHSDLYVRPDNVIDVLAIAIEVRAPRLVAHCEDFIKNNRSFVEAFQLPDDSQRDN